MLTDYRMKRTKELPRLAINQMTSLPLQEKDVRDFCCDPPRMAPRALARYSIGQPFAAVCGYLVTTF